MDEARPFWSIEAVNLPEHADNPVHTEAGGRAAGYPGAVVAGTTVYAYLTRWPATVWGADWVRGGGAEVRFLAAVIAGDPLDVVAGDATRTADIGGRTATVEARVAGESTARGEFRPVAPRPDPPAGDRLEPLVVELDAWAGYAARTGDDLELYGRVGLVHPVVWLSLANRVFSRQLVDGPWVHTRSRVAHLDGVAPDATVLVEAFLLDRFTTRAGERAVVDVRISVDDRPVVAVEHEAIVRLG